MPHPRPKVPNTQRLINMPESLCRTHRRKLANRHRSSAQSSAISISKSETDQVAGHANRRQSGMMSHAQPLNQRWGSELFLRAIVEACASNVAVLDECARILYVSKSWRLSAERNAQQGVTHPLELDSLERRNNSNLLQSQHPSALAEDIQDILNGNVREFHNEYSGPGLSGSSWFAVHAARLDLPGAAGAFRILVNSFDITHARQTEETIRDLGGRLITAQEEERSRVARELHDDLNQRMALLSVELEQLSQRMPASQNGLRLAINNVWQRAQEISSEIQRMSYQLHPSKLDHLGLVAAVKSHCLELASHHEIRISFQEKNCSGLLPKDVTLCLFRIVQESFRNVIKHSGAREASVVLVGTPDAIHLSVSDSGRGFAVDSMESKSGLGLISMRERLRLVGGVISIKSNARGTKIDVRVPLTFPDQRPAETSPMMSNPVSYLAPLNL